VRQRTIKADLARKIDAPIDIGCDFPAVAGARELVHLIAGGGIRVYALRIARRLGASAPKRPERPHPVEGTGRREPREACRKTS